MSSDFDVAIIGGGPAGCAAAIWCACAGLKVVLLEAERYPRDRPGESLHPGIEVLFKQLGVEDAVDRAGFLRYRGYLVRWQTKFELQEFGKSNTGPWLGFQARRSVLDNILLQRALELGVTVLQPCRALNPVLISGRMAGLDCSNGKIKTRFVIDAGGNRHWLQRKLGLQLTKTIPPLFASYGYSRIGDEDIASLPVLLGEAMGWTWIAKVSPGTLAWTQLTFEKLQKLPPACLDAFQPLSPVRGADVTWRIVNECAGNGYFMIGDSACVVDPAGSHGVLRAIMSGILAGNLIVQVTAKKIDENRAAMIYRSWTSQWFTQDTSNLRQLYSHLCPSSPIWQEAARR